MKIVMKEDYSSFKFYTKKEVISFMHTEKIRIYPNKTQQKAIDDILWNCKELYNYLLDLNIRTYKETGKSLLGYKTDKCAQKFSKKKIPGKVRQTVINRLNDAFHRFFKKQNRFPKFKSIQKYRSFTQNQYKHGFTFDKTHIRIGGVGKIKAVFTRDLLGIPKTCTIKKMSSGKYYAFIVLDDKDVPKVEINQPEDCVAIDLGVSRFYTDENGNYVSSPRFLRRNLKKLRKAQRELSRKQKGSNNRRKARIKVARLHEKVADTRRDFHFKVAYYLVTTYREVICEDLRTSKMFLGKSKKDKLSLRALRDNGLYNFLVILQQMAIKYGCKLTKVPPEYTSQICSNCGAIVKKDLSVRVHKCPHCGLEIDRDVNAARNILWIGKNKTPEGTPGGTKVPTLVEILIPGTEGSRQAE